jgi:hypothetical protein
LVAGRGSFGGEGLPDDFWSTIAAGMAMDKIIDLSGDFGR